MRSTPPAPARAAPRPGGAAWASPCASTTPRRAPRPPTSRRHVPHLEELRLSLEALLAARAAETDPGFAAIDLVERGGDVHGHPADGVGGEGGGLGLRPGPVAGGPPGRDDL